MRGSFFLGLMVLGLVEGGVRRPKKIREGSECHQLPWLSTPKYPCGQDNGRDDEGYYSPIKKNHTVRNYQIPIKDKKD
ncbi:MAG: hypothetical protein MIO87_01885 [Methanomassiliicoccales archaeon]|nr:hypothetical protein [Methanomassiliicoccales archaeon]TFG56809.1 MAG: hypothetical protein E4H30_02755 [Methanomassiliicoccus sp.]